MSLGDKITGDVYYNGNTLAVTMQEYVELDGVKFVLVTPPTVVREGMVSENSQLNGMTKYSFVFYHPMYMLGNFPFTDVAVTSSEAKYLSESKKFTWIGYPDDFIAKVNKNLDGTEWIVEKSSRFPAYLDDQLSDVLSFDGNTIADACKTFYDTWGAPYIVAKVESTEAAYANGKRFKVIFGLPSNEIYEDAAHQQSGTPYIFRFGKGVGLKNNSRTPRGNKIVTRIAGSGSENNIPYGYPQIPWYGDSRWDYTEYEGDTINYDSDGHVTNTPKTTAYPLYMGIVGGAYVKLIKHPFTRTNLMPSIYGQTLFNKVSPYLSDGTANPDYDPNTTLIDYYDAIATQEYPYPNPIVANAPSYESHQFEDIKPELGQNVAIVDAYPVNKDMTPAQAWDDSMDDDGNYVQSYFKMQLPVLSFDLYACAAITQEMQINMRSGACLGCTFTIQVDWDDYKRNFYDEDGNFAPTGSQRDYTKYPDSTQEQITVVLQKETATFGTLMPNMYQYPVADDAFVVLGISLPLSYIESAEERLDGEMKSYMLENNVHYFDYPLKFDEAFLRNNPYILSQIKPNSIVRFQYGNDTMQLFVKQMSVKYGEGVLPKYDITLTDNVEVVLNRIGQVAEDVEKLASLIAILRQNYNRSVWNELAKKLSKTQDDTAAGYITMLKGLQVGANFVPDILGEGGCLRMREDGKVELVTDILYTRMRAYFDSVVIREYRHESGNRIKSPAQGFNASRVENIKVVEGIETIVDDASEADFFRCYWRVDDGEKKAENQFIIGDLAFCEHSDIVNGSLVTKRYWRVVIGRNAGNTTTADGEAWIDLSNAHDANGNPVMTTISWEGQGGATQTLSVKSFESSANSYPEAHDDICMLGCTTDTTRQGAIIEYVSGVDAPTYQIYQGLGADATNPYSLSGKNQIGFGYNTSTGRAYMNVYGDFRFGARPNTQGSYLEYNSQTGALNIKAHVEFTNTDQELDTLVQNHQRDDSYDDTEVRGLISGLQEQIDGQIETWFYNYSPVNVDASGAPTSNVPLNVAPYSDWTTDNDKIAHLGDTFTNNSTGYCWRFTRNEETNAFEWVIIEDSAVIAALQNAARAQDTADHKRRVFICDSSHQTPTPPYDEGDLWVNVKYPWATGATYDNEILKCIKSVPRTEGGQEIGVFNINDWSLANGYTAKLNNFVNNTYAPFVQNIQGQVDKKAETFRQATDPSTPWYEEDAETHEVITDTRAQHTGDLWMDISENGGNKTYIYQNTGSEETPVYEWVAQEVPDEVFDEIDGKAEIFVTKPTTYNERDMWIIESGTAAADIPTGCQVGDIVVSNHKRTNSYTKGDWSKKDRYTDDSKFNGYISAFLSGSGASGDSATAAAIQRAITTALGSALGSATLISGGLMLTSMIGMRQLTGSDPSSISDYTTWGGISGEYNANDETVQGGAKGHGIAAWYGGDMVDKQMLSDADIAAGWGETLPDESTNYRWARSLFRFDGSGYIADANIYWDKVGSMTIKNLQTIYGTQAGVSVDINTLSSLTGIFNTETKSGTGFTELLVKPQNAFSRLYLNRGAAVASYPSDGSINDYAVLNFAEMKARFITIDWLNQILKVHYKASAEGADTILSPNNSLPSGAVDVSLESVFSFWTEYAISALGQGIDGSHAIGALSDLSDVIITNPAANQILKYNGTHWVNGAAPETYTLPQATANALGGIKIGYSGTGKNYPIVLDNDGKAYVNVPWTDTTYTLAGLMGSTAIGGTTQPIYWNGSAFVNTTYTLGKSVPSDAVFTDTTYTNGTGLALSSGTFSINSTYQNYITHGESAYNSLSNYLPLSGGTLTGALGKSNNYLIKPVADFRTASPSFTGCITITLPATIGNTMVSMWVDVYNYYRNTSFSVHCGGYTYSNSTWANSPFAMVYGSNQRVRFGHNGTNFIIYIGETDTTWSYPQISVRDVVIGFDPTYSNWYKDWSISFSTSVQNVTADITRYAITSSNIGSQSVSYATSAGSAAQLTTSRSLWGNSFNGTGDINGNIVMAATDGTYIQIGGARIVWDNTNKALKVIQSDNSTAANFYATGAISALGQGVDGGGGGQGDVTWALLASSSDTRQIALSHLTTALSGYATQSWVGNNYLSLSGGTMNTNAVISRVGIGEYWYRGRFSPIIKTTSYTGYNTILSIKTTDGSWDLGAYSDNIIYFTYVTDTNYNAGINSYAYQLAFPKKGGTLAVVDDIPTNNNQLTNGAGYITSSASITGNAANVTGTVAIGHGGTGATTAAAARANLGTWALISDTYDTLIKADGSTNGWIKIGTSNSIYGLLPSTSGSAGSGHNYIGTSSWYWKYAYIDQIYGYLNGNISGSSTSCSGNAATATSAGKATNDSDGNAINATYLKLSGGTMTGKLTFSQGASTRDNGIVGTYDPYKAAAIWAMGSSYQIKSDGTSLNTLYGAAYAYFGTGYTFTGYSGGHSFLWCQNGAIYAAIGDNIWAKQGFVKNGSNNNYALTGGGGHLQISDSNTNSTIVKRTGSGYIYGTYFNQSSSAETPTTSSYLMYANSDGFLRKSSLADVRKILYPKLGIGSYGGMNSTTKIKINITSAKYWMLCFTVTLYQDYRATKVMISGYNYGVSHWYQPKARVIGDSDGTETISVYFGYDSDLNLWVGFDGGNYTGVTVSDVVNGYDQIDDFEGLFTISNVSSLSTLQTTVTAESRANIALHDGDGNNITSTYLKKSLSTEGSLTNTSSSWGWSFANTNGGSTKALCYLCHGSGYGMFLKGYTTSASIYLLEVVNNSYEQFSVYGDGRIYMRGNVGINTSSPSYKLHVDGDIYATGGVTCASDIRLKDVLSYQLPLTVEQVAQAPTIKFLWKNKREEGEQVGSVAQYWQKVLPQSVSDKSDELGLSYGVAALISAITTARKVVDHEREIAQLKERVSALEKENEQLKLKIA